MPSEITLTEEEVINLEKKLQSQDIKIPKDEVRLLKTILKKAREERANIDALARLPFDWIYTAWTYRW